MQGVAILLFTITAIKQPLNDCTTLFHPSSSYSQNNHFPPLVIVRIINQNSDITFIQGSLTCQILLKSAVGKINFSGHGFTNEPCPVNKETPYRFPSRLPG